MSSMGLELDRSSPFYLWHRLGIHSFTMARQCQSNETAQTFQPAIVKVWAGLRAPNAKRHCWRRFGKRLCAAVRGQRYIAVWRIKKSALTPVNQFTEFSGGAGNTHCGSFQSCLHCAWRNGNHVVLKKTFKVDLLRVRGSARVVQDLGPTEGRVA